MSEPILIDISAAVNQDAGIGRYARELTRELIPLLPQGESRLWFASDAGASRSTILQSPPWNTLAQNQSRLSRRMIDRLSRFGQVRSRHLLGSGDPEDSYSPDFTTPPGRRDHVTIHDLAWLHPEAETPKALATYLSSVVNREICNVSTVFTVSNAIRTEILERFALPDERVVVASNAPTSLFFDAEPLDSFELMRLGIDRSFLLLVGTIEPRKNVRFVLDAMRHLPEDLMLVLAGKGEERVTQLLSPLEYADVRPRVIQMGFVEDALLSRLYASAYTVVYPSRYEGFGLPIVEALAAGTPVAASNLPVFREIGGDDITYFDPAEVESFIEAISTATDVQNSTDRSRRIRRARGFDWHYSAQIVANRLQELR